MGPRSRHFRASVPSGASGLSLLSELSGSDPGAGQADLKVGQRLVNQRPDRGVETHARTVLGLRGRAGGAEADVSMQTFGMGRDLAGFSFFRVFRLGYSA